MKVDFPSSIGTGRVMAPRGAKCVYSICSPSKKQITTLVCVSAAGQVIPPMHIFPGERFRFNPLEGGVYGLHQDGWI